MNKFVLNYVMLSILLISGCQTTSFENIREEQISVEVRLPQVWQRSLNQGAIPQNWATLFNDPLLKQYMAAAEERNPDISRAIINVRQSEAGLKESRAVLLPIISSDAQISGITGLNDFAISESSDYGFSASWNPGLFGRNKIAIRRAESLLDVSKANEERIRRIVMAQVARAYIQIIETDYQFQLAKDNLDFIGETLRISEARFKAGDIARDQFALAQLETANAEANVTTLELSSRTLRRSFANLIGKNPDASLQVSTALPTPAIISLSILPAEVLGRRFDVAASRAQVISIFGGLQQAERLNWPSLSLTGRLSGNGLGFEDIFDINGYIASLGAALTSTLFDGGRKSAQIESVRLAIDEALINYDEVLRDALLDVENGFDSVVAAQKSLKALEQGSIAANRVLELEKTKYDLGESTLLDVLTVQMRVNSILASYISTNRQLLDAQIDTYLALGGNF